MIAETARVYDEQLREEINADREAHGKKPLKERKKESKTKEITVSETDPDCGIFRKGEHKVEFAYETHTACDARGFVLGYEGTAGNVHDSVAFDPLYDQVTERFPEIKTVTMDNPGSRPEPPCTRRFRSFLFYHPVQLRQLPPAIPPD